MSALTGNFGYWASTPSGTAEFEGTGAAQRRLSTYNHQVRNFVKNLGWDGTMYCYSSGFSACGWGCDRGPRPVPEMMEGRGRAEPHRDRTGRLGFEAMPVDLRRPPGRDPFCGSADRDGDRAEAVPLDGDRFLCRASLE